MRETTLVMTARSLSAPILAELAQLLGDPPLPLERVEPDEDEAFVAAVWQEVGDDLRDAMRTYPLSAAADTDKPIPTSTP